jgi:hypothetical protein
MKTCSTNQMKMRFYSSKNLSRVITTVAFLPAWFLLAQFAFGQSNNNDKNQQLPELMLLIEKAEQNEYNVKYVEFCCPEKIRGRVLFGQINKFINEGDIFTRQNLYQSLAALSKLKAIYPVNIENVSVRLNEKERIIHITYNIRERKK